MNKTLRELTLKTKAAYVMCVTVKKTAHAADQMSEKPHFHPRREKSKNKFKKKKVQQTL